MEIYTDIKSFGELSTQGKKINKLCVMFASNSYIDQTLKHDTSYLWHTRLAHVNYDRLQETQSRGLVNELPKMKVNTNTICIGCQSGKMHKLSFKENLTKSSRPLQLIHSDFTSRISTLFFTI